MSLFGIDEKQKRGRLTKADQINILERQKYRCAGCKIELTRDIPVHWDHKKALSLGGSDSIKNIQALCPTCHAKKTRQDRGKIAKKKQKEKEDPLGLRLPSSTKSHLDITIGTKRKRRRKKKDPWEI